MFAQFDVFEAKDRFVKHGLTTGNDDRFVRAWWETRGQSWLPFAKGGSHSPYYVDQQLVLKWHTEGAELRAGYTTKSIPGTRMDGSTYFGLAGLTWPLRARSFSPQVLSRGGSFSARGYCAFFAEENLLPSLALTNSKAFDYIFKVALGRFGYPEFIVGILQVLPWPDLAADASEEMGRLAYRSWSLKRNLDTIDETSHAFLLPAALRARLGDYDPPSIETELADIQAEIDDIAFDLYGFSDADRAAALGPSASTEEDNSNGAEDADESEDDDGAEAIDQTDGLLSWAAGVAFGRLDWRLATGEREAPPEPDPFDPLPAKSPGMLPHDAEPFHAHSGILVDDQGHPNDLARLIEEVLARVEAPVPADVRRWLQRDFFPLHLKQYSKSRRKAPIYWPISTSSGSYTLWLYYPSLTDQTLFTAVNDFIEPKLSQVGQDVAALRTKGSARSRDDEKSFEALQGLELELIELRDTLLAIAQTYRPNQDDGVQITASPLWQLFRHKPWQKVLKDTWTKLEKGDYDWAHLAMAYWPDRVRGKCETDKSLAIAHDLEHLYVEPEPKPTKARGRKKDG
ncbi:hypothetical protein [Litoreibacter ponti]|nr:hypothetical protein [Litoreibacter ponti]